MNKTFLLTMVAALTVLVPGMAQAEHTRVTYPLAVSGEVLGRALMFSVNVDYVFSDELAAGMGIGGVGTKFDLTPAISASTDTTATLLPFYLNYYFVQDANSLYFTGGVSIVTNSNDVKMMKSSTGNVEFPDGPVIPSAGLGFESRTDTGWLFRVAGYALFAEKVSPWGGFSFGKTF